MTSHIVEKPSVQKHCYTLEMTHKVMSLTSKVNFKDFNKNKTDLNHINIYRSSKNMRRGDLFTVTEPLKENKFVSDIIVPDLS